MVKKLPAMQETQLRSLGWEDTLDKGRATHSSILAWEIPRTEDPGELRFLGSQRDKTDRISTHAHTGIYYTQTQSWAPGLLTPGGKNN